MNKETKEFIRMINMWFKIYFDYDAKGIDYEQLEEVGITFNIEEK